VAIVQRSIRVNGRTVRYFDAGKGSPLVLLHAFPLCADMWRPQLECVPSGWRLMTPDVKGFGPASHEAAVSIDDLAADAIAWLDAMGLDRAAIGGLSMGGYITFALFRAAPERFSAMILANTRAAADSAEGRTNRDRMSALVRAQGVEAVADEMLPKLLGETARRSRPELEPQVRAMIRVNRVEGIDGAIQAMKNRPDSVDLLSSIQCPALVIAGAQDALIPQSEAEAMMQRLPQAQLVTIAAAGHLSNLEAPDQFCEAVNAFMIRVS
jgi:3-oxoadipate enol-lactonase